MEKKEIEIEVTQDLKRVMITACMRGYLSASDVEALSNHILLETYYLRAVQLHQKLTEAVSHE